ncbi:single-stranded-DNA-specific exonuclease RecJ [Caproiciproducens galactitolivorans]|uniref:single-stranded-DNA-specific exonuclease RecJ n=1 Tax=Caproiciproducens galactitolivorans TaxID=642589 RepID=UPI00240A0F2C|nr:single-stranded-DNA-specific exonuclease RecJ [Caproiciproducens galactitolivorans]
MSLKKWEVFQSDPAVTKQMTQEMNLPEILAVLLQERGIVDIVQIEKFFHSDENLSNPFLLKDMKKAADRIIRAIEEFEKIAVYGDYDADGVTATAMLYSYLESCGANVIFYIPEREGEGYGLNCNAIDTLHAQEINLIVTVDNGISSIAEVAHAKELGMDVVVTDHHRPRAELPDACAVVDPYREDCDCPYKDYSGVGVAFKLIMALEGEDCSPDALLDNYADLVAIGTIGDVVPLTGENRCFVKAGLKMLPQTDRLGLKALMELAGVEGRRLTAGNVAFTLVPRINATGRIGSPERAVRLLVSEYPDEACALSTEINDDNEYRRQIEKEIYEKVMQKLHDEPERLYDRVLVIEGEGWHHGVIGIISSRITEQFGKPSIIISYSGEEAKGSGRSVEGFSLFQAVNTCNDLLLRYGGHPMAAGLSLLTANIPAFRKAINDYAASLGDPMPVPVLKIDCLLNPRDLSVDIPNQIHAMEPFGMGNPSPLFGLYHVTLADITPVGGGKHLRISVMKDGYMIRCMKFNTTLEEFRYHVGDVLDLAVTLDAREYNGKNTLSIYIRDIKLSSMDVDAVLSDIALYEKTKRGETLSQMELERLFPNRGAFADVYRVIRNLNGFSGSPEILLSRTKDVGNMAMLLTALDVLAEYRLITLEKFGDWLKAEIVHTTHKVDLFGSKILKKLKLLEKVGEGYGMAAENI